MTQMPTAREQEIVALLLQGCENKEIADKLGMAPRTVKAHFNRMFLRFQINRGVKRVKLAVLLYRNQLCQERVFPVRQGRPLGTDLSREALACARNESSSLLLKDSKTGKSLNCWEYPNTSSKTTSASSMTNSDYGTASNLPCGGRRTAPNLIEGELP